MTWTNTDADCPLCDPPIEGVPIYENNRVLVCEYGEELLVIWKDHTSVPEDRHVVHVKGVARHCFGKHEFRSSTDHNHYHGIVSDPEFPDGDLQYETPADPS